MTTAASVVGRDASTSSGGGLIGVESTVVLEHAMHAQHTTAKKTACFAIAVNTSPGDNGIETLTRVMADDDDQKVPHFATARPPPGEEDVYSASTVASEASDEILAIIRGESQRAIPAAPGVPKNLKVDPKSDPKIEIKPDAKAAAKASDLMPTKPPPPAAGAPPPPAPVKPASKPAYGATPLEVPVTNLTPTSEPPRGVEIAPDPEPEPAPTKDAEAKARADAAADAEADAKAEAEAKAEPTAITKGALQKDDETGFRKSTMHPAVGIVLFFVAVLAVLAALIR